MHPTQPSRTLAALLCRSLLLLGLAAPVPPAWAASQSNSCLVRKTDVAAIAEAQAEEADDRFSALRPCEGRVKKGKVEIIFSTGDGITERTDVTEGQSVRSKLEKTAGGNLVDIWPKRSLLASAVDLLKGRRITTSGLSGFDEKNGALPINGEVFPLPGLVLRMKFHGWDETGPVQVSQKGWSETLNPSGGVVTLPISKMKPGELRVVQGKNSAVLTVATASAIPELEKMLSNINSGGGTAQEKSMRKALLFQENQYLINSLAEFHTAQ